MSPDIVEILILDTSTLLPTVCEAKLAEVNTMEKLTDFTRRSIPFPVEHASISFWWFRCAPSDDSGGRTLSRPPGSQLFDTYPENSVKTRTDGTRVIRVQAIVESSTLPEMESTTAPICPEGTNAYQQISGAEFATEDQTPDFWLEAYQAAFTALQNPDGGKQEPEDLNKDEEVDWNNEDREEYIREFERCVENGLTNYTGPTEWKSLGKQRRRELTHVFLLGQKYGIQNPHPCSFCSIPGECRIYDPNFRMRVFPPYGKHDLPTKCRVCIKHRTKCDKGE